MPLTPAVAGVLEDIPRVPDNPWVIAGQKPGARMTNVNDPWLIVRAWAGLEDARNKRSRNLRPAHNPNVYACFADHGDLIRLEHAQPGKNP